MTDFAHDVISLVCMSTFWFRWRSGSARCDEAAQGAAGIPRQAGLALVKPFLRPGALSAPSDRSAPDVSFVIAVLVASNLPN